MIRLAYSRWSLSPPPSILPGSKTSTLMVKRSPKRGNHPELLLIVAPEVDEQDLAAGTFIEKASHTIGKALLVHPPRP